MAINKEVDTDGLTHLRRGAATEAEQDEALLHRLLQDIWTPSESKRYHGLWWSTAGEDDKGFQFTGINRASERDYELACLLALGTSDGEQIERLMRASQRVREKWDKHKSYMARTINGALDATYHEYLKRHRPKTNETTGTADDGEPLDITALELANNPALLQVPPPLSPWLTWRGEYSILVGREKTGKSTTAACDAVAALTKGLRVLWVTAEESPNRVLTRFKDLQAPLANLLLLRRWPQSWDEVEAVIERRQPDVIYVDSQASFLFAVDGEVPQTSELEKWQAKGLRFKRWCTLVPEHSAGVTVLVHANKATGEFAGSVGIGAATDTIITMRTVADHPNDRLLDKRGRWSFPSQVIRYVDAVQGYVEAATDATVGEHKPKPLKGEILKVLTALRSGMSYSEWEKAYGGNADTFKSYVRRLKERGLVTQDEVTGAWSKVEFEAQQELSEAA